MPMINRACVMAALKGEPVDRVPLAFQMHNLAGESPPRETLQLAREFGWDFLKPPSRAQYLAEVQGLRYRASGERPLLHRHHEPCACASDLARLQPADPRGGPLGDQLEALRLIRAAVGPDTPIIWTVFSPLIVVPNPLRGRREQPFAIMHSESSALGHALNAIAETLAGYTQACLDADAHGLF